jgi:L-fucose mutarotase
MLKGIPTILSPDLMKVLLEMGHGDEIVLADGNFPAVSCAQRLIRFDGHNIPELLDAIMTFLPLDTYVDHSASLMEVGPNDPIKPTIWEEYRSIVKQHNPPFEEFEYVERHDFYERAKNAFAIVATSEKALYANIILKKGVVTE